MTPEDWKEAESKLSYPFGRAEFLIDGYRVTVMVVEEKPLKYALAVYVDGKINLEWALNDCEIRRKFYFESKRSLLTAKERKRLNRVKKTVRDALLVKSEYIAYMPYFNSFRSLKSKFVNNNSSIELVVDEKYDTIEM